MIQRRTLLNILWAAAVLGVLVKKMHWPFANVLLVLSLSSLVVLFFLPKGGALEQPEWISTRTEVYGLMFARYGIATQLIVILFVLQRWPGAQLYVFVGSALSAIAAGILWKAQRGSPELRGTYTPLIRLLVVLSVAAILLRAYRDRILLWIDPDLIR